MALSDITKAKSPLAVSSDRRARRQRQEPKTLATAQLMEMNQLDEANARLSEYEGALPVRELDPNEITITKFANRHASHFDSKEFASLREDILLAGGNTVPIMVRPAKSNAEYKYEVIFGHRRLQACRDANVKVRALIEDVSDEEMFALMVRENNEREDLSAYEEAVSYKAALDAGLYRNQQALSDAIGVTQGRISQVLALTKVPASILNLFSSPTKVQYRWAKEILSQLAKDRSTVMNVVKDLKGRQNTLSDKAIYDALTSRQLPEKTEVKVDGQLKATIVSEGNSVKVVFAKNALNDQQTRRVAVLLSEFFAGD